MTRARFLLDIALAYLLFWGAHTVYRGSTGTIQMCDSTYSLVTAEKLITTGSLNLIDCVPSNPAARQAMPGYRPDHDMPYHFVRRPDAVYYGYPLGSTVLSLPWVRHYVRDRGLTMLQPDGVPSYAVEGVVQLRVASRVAALTVVLFYAMCRFLCPPAVAFLIAAGFAFGSPVWSTLARALWSHTWTVFWLSAAVVLLLSARRVREPTWRTDALLGLGLGTALFWMTFCRQHAVFSAAAIGLYLLLHHRRLLAFTVVFGGAWAAGLVAFSTHVFGTPIPPSVYASNVIDGHDVLNRFAWLMVSPSRGLLVFCPYLLVVGAMLLGFRKHLSDAGVLLPSAVAVGAHTAVFAAYNGWHAGYSYGPRYFCDVLPWFVLATSVAVSGMLNAPGMRWRKAGAVVALVVGFAWGGFVHGRGANSHAAWMWNVRERVAGEEGAVKEWRYPQFLAGLTFEVKEDGTIK